MQSWRLLDLEFRDAASNLALEEALARAVGEGKSPPTLRFWRNPRSVILGENQSVRLELELSVCRELGVAVIRRFTGGGAVYHDLGSLNYSICTPKPSPSSLPSQQEVFRKAVECAVTCLRVLNLDSSQVPVNTVMVRGHKISGGAAAIRWRAIFYHGSILVSTDLEIVWKVLRRDQPLNAAGFVQSTRVPITSIERELDRKISIDLAKEALMKAFTETFRASLTPGNVTEEELQMASRLVKEKYGNDEWNLKI